MTISLGNHLLEIQERDKAIFDLVLQVKKLEAALSITDTSSDNETCVAEQMAQEALDKYNRLGGITANQIAHVMKLYAKNQIA